MNEVTINVSTKTEEEIEILIAELIEIGFRPETIDHEWNKAFLIENVNKGCGYADYVSDELLNPAESGVYLRFYSDNEKLKVFNTFCEFYNFDGSFEIKDVSGIDFENAWKKYFKPIEIGTIAIVPFWEQYNHNKKFIINPGNLFGTGFHESTRSCIEILQNINIQNKKVLDIGCGTGILGLISLMLGAKKSTFVDIEPIAPKIVEENAHLNSLKNFDVYVGNMLEGEVLENLITYDVIFMNIVADVIIKMLPIVRSLMNEKAKLIMAGIIRERRDDVFLALKREGFNVVNEEILNEWVSITAERRE